MKAIPALLAMAVSGLAAPSEPGVSAVGFLEKVRTKNLNLEPGADTALSPQTSEQKRKEIARRLERLARDLGNDPLEVGSVKLDGELAAVIVRKIGGYDPGKLQVFPVAMVKRGADWAAAPVPASFENAGVGYSATLRKRLESLEEWMLQERVIDLENLREQSTARMRRQVEEKLPAATLRQFNSQEAGERFLSACEHRKLPEILGLLGGLAASLPDDWAIRLRSADSALAAASEVVRPWRLLIAPEVLRIPVYHDEDPDGKSAILSIACLDPAGNPPKIRTPKVELIHLSLAKSTEGLWRIDPPSEFLLGSPSAADGSNDDLDTDLLDMFPAKLSMKYPISPGSTAEEARDALLKSFSDSHPSSWARLISIQGEPADRRGLCARAAQTWWESRARQPAALAFHEDGDRAVAACQFFDARNPDRLDLKFLFFGKSPMGWLWDPASSDETRAAFREWTDQQSAKWQDTWQDELLKDCPKLAKIPESPAPTEEESRKLVESWLKATRNGDLAAALHLTARLDTPDSRITLFRNLGFEMTGARMSQQAPAITGVQRGEIWTAVGTRLALDGKSSFPLYPVIGTPSGPRILLEVDLQSSGNRSRDYLNSQSLERLRGTSPDAADELKKLFSTHQAETKEKSRPQGGS